MDKIVRSITKDNTYIIGCNQNGLGNRLHCFFTTQYLAKLLHRKFRYLWLIEDHPFGCAASPADLFSDTILDTFLTSYNQILAAHYVDNYTSCMLAYQEYNFVYLDNFDVIFNTYHDSLYGAHTEFYNMYRANIFSKYIVDGIKGYNLSDAVGVHIRRGDLVKEQYCKEHYNPEAIRTWVIDTQTYFDFIDEHYPSSPIFVMSEDKKELEEFKQKYGNRILHYENRRWGATTRSVQEVQDVLIELLLLKECKCILGGTSSLPRLSSRLGRKPLTTLKGGFTGGISQG